MWAAICEGAGISLRENRTVLLLVFLYIVSCFVLAHFFGFTLDLDIYRRKAVVLPALSMAVMLLPPIVWKLARTRPSKPFHFVSELLVRDWRVPQRFMLALPVLIFLPVFLSAYSSVKNGIPLIHPFSLDPILIEIDRTLHGTDAWRILQPILGFPTVTRIIDGLYFGWFVLMYATPIIVAGWIERPILRRQFLICFILCWMVIGTFGAILASSVGPCFYGDFYSNRLDVFAPLSDYLLEVNRQSRLYAVVLQNILWERALLEPGLGSGISAMPSLHVAVAMLHVMLGWSISRFIGTVATIYLGIIMIGSVHLGWHYAVDGYVSVVCVAVLWKLSGRFGLPMWTAWRAEAIAPAALSYGTDAQPQNPASVE